VDTGSEAALADTDPVVADADPAVVGVWSTVAALARGALPEMGLAAGGRPAADVDVLATVVGAAEFELARRMHAARTAGCLPLHDPGAMLTARGWSLSVARRLARCGALAAGHPSIAGAWSAGLITAEHVDPVARAAERFTEAELSAVIAELGPHWGRWSPAAIARFVEAAARILHPPADPDPDEADAHEQRGLSFSVTRDTVLLSGQLPRLEGEVVIAAIDAFAERLRSTADHVPASARRADALVALVNAAHAAGALPTRGGLPVSLTVTLDHTSAGDPVWRTSRGRLLTAAEERFCGCDAQVTPVLVGGRACGSSVAAVPSSLDSASPAARIAALAALMFDTRMPLAVGRTQRTATPAQRRALAVRDRGCIIPGCTIPAEACQTHHLTPWAAGGRTDLSEMVLLCWAHHRQVDLTMWTIAPLAEALPSPSRGAPPGTPWPANNRAPWTVTRTPRHQWRL
jgi:hypothetical protein